MKYFFVLLIFSYSIFAQPENIKWEVKEFDYQILKVNEEDYKSNSFLSSLQKIYTFLISEHDGDNCPFSPSCSNFYIEAVEKTNLIIGTFLFADRFTRDMNPFKDLHRYKIINKKKLHDPVDNYISSNRSNF